MEQLYSRSTSDRSQKRSLRTKKISSRKKDLFWQVRFAVAAEKLQRTRMQKHHQPLSGEKTSFLVLDSWQSSVPTTQKTSFLALPDTV
jgi:hypothetical protein